MKVFEKVEGAVASVVGGKGLQPLNLMKFIWEEEDIPMNMK